MPSVYPATLEEMYHKYFFIMEVLSKMGLPLLDKETKALAQKFLSDIAEKGGKTQ